MNLWKAKRIRPGDKVRVLGVSFCKNVCDFRSICSHQVEVIQIKENKSYQIEIFFKVGPRKKDWCSAYIDGIEIVKSEILTKI